MQKNENIITAILLAGGRGCRFGTTLPKQFLPLNNQIMVNYSLQLFDSIEEISEIIVVVDQNFASYFNHPKALFAIPGKRRQDSVFSGLKKASSDWILVHDASRPLVKRENVLNLIDEGKRWGAATLAVKAKDTIKLANNSFVSKNLDRDSLHHIQTPQFLKKSLLQKGLEFALKNKITVTDDVSCAELLNHPVKLVLGNYSNIKITTKEDLLIAQTLLNNRL